MVKTRHSQGSEDLPDIPIMGTRGSRKSIEPPKEEEVHSDESGVSTLVRRETRNQGVFDCSMMAERMTRRPRRANRNSFFYEDSTEDDEPPRRARRRSVNKKQWSPMKRSPPADVEEFEEGEHPDEIRRSTRQKKTVYPTLNKNFLDKAVVSSKDGFGGSEEHSVVKEQDEDVEEDAIENNEGFTDMYSRVKRKRRHIRKDMYGVPIIDTDCESSGLESCDDDDDDRVNDEEREEEEAEESCDDKPQKSYFLREHKPRTQKYEAPSIKPIRKTRADAIFNRETPPRTISYSSSRSKTYRSPAHRRRHHRKRAAFHGSSSTSSSSDTGSESSDEERFQRRKAKSMHKARNRCLPLNLTKEDMNTGILKDRSKIGASLADVDPMEVDRSITFESVGGLDKHVRALKEMVVFPLLYPEVFEKFKINPPRGCIFYGPPGTGKTLVARALANECSHGDRRVAFFMRKGADCLSKWVGESERQLRLLFDQAYQARPAIIFFDEIDGLAPVRSSRQDQIHSSIVSTLLALMDGLDSRGEIVVIGATNRIDSIDPALRRPGRFDREFLFPLPSLSARKQILSIHTKGWSPKLSPEFISELGEKCVGYCGADMKALCTEATLNALRRRYPQIYTSSEKLQLNVNSISLAAQDFFQAMKTIVPTAQRSVTSPGRALCPIIQPLLRRAFNQTLKVLQEIFPSILAQMSSLDKPSKDNELEFDDIYTEGYNDDSNIYDKGQHKHRDNLPPSFLSFTSCAYQQPTTFRPRLMLCGTKGQGQTSHLAPSILHHLEQLPVHVLDLPTLYAVSAKTPEESCAQVFNEAKRTAPSILYLPMINKWYDVLGDTVRATFFTLIHNLSPSTPILMLATSEQPYDTLQRSLQGLFELRSQEVIHMTNPTADERQEYYNDLVLHQTIKAPLSSHSRAARRYLEVLPKAPPPKPRKLTENELKKLKDQEDATLRELRIFLRDVLTKLGRDRKFCMFTKPVDLEEVPDYLVIIKHPMDMSTMMTKIDLHEYLTVEEFMSDIDLICRNALEYNPAKDPAGRAIRHRACAFKDTAYAIIKAELNSEFEKQCQEIKQARKRRGLVSREVPEFYYTAPPVPSRNTPTATVNTPVTVPKPVTSIPSTERYSRRVRGINVEKHIPLEMVEKNWQVEKKLSKLSPEKQESGDKRRSLHDHNEHSSQSRDNSAKRVRSDSSSRPPPKKKAKKCIWASTKRRRRTKSVAAVYDRDSDARSGLDTDFEDDSDFGKLSDKEDELNKMNEEEPKTDCSTLVQDSGLGSSLDSNGDSRDSADHRLTADTVTETPEIESRAKSSNNNTSSSTKKADHHKSPSTVSVDKNRLNKLLDTIVSSTSNYTVDHLEKLYSILSQCIYRHRNEYDKLPLVKEMEEKVSWFTKTKTAH